MKRAQLLSSQTTFWTRRRRLFLSVVRGSTYGFLHNLVVLASPKNKSFEEIIEVLKAHFEPKSIVIIERYRFQQEEQAPGESVTAYMVELCCLASTSTFGEYFDRTLCDCLVCDLRSESIQRNLLSEMNLNLSRAVKVAQGMEAAHKNAETLKSPELHIGKVEKVQQSKRASETSRQEGHAGIKPCYHCRCTGHLPCACGFKEAIYHAC